MNAIDSQTASTPWPVAVIAFKIIDKVIGMRASDEEHLLGLDLTERGAEGFPEFMGGMSGVPAEVPLASPGNRGRPRPSG